MRHYHKKSAVKPRTGSSWTLKELCAARGMCTPDGKPAIPGVLGGGKLAIVELGGGWVQSDLDMFADREGIPRFRVNDVSTDNKTNNSKDPTQDASGEVALDIQAAVAAYYFTFGQLPTMVDILWDEDITNALAYAVANGYDVFSCSWGAPEKQWGRVPLNQLATTVDRAIKAGLTVLSAAGDNSSSDGAIGTNVDAPASVPGVIGCGGTSWANPSAEEVVWGDGNPKDGGTGGGYSSYFKKQTYQVGIPGNTNGKMVPDWSDVADPATGVEIAINGSIQVIGGTSFVAPFIAGFLCGVGHGLGKVYSKIWSAPAAFKDVTKGSNGRYRAQSGPDPCSGLGCMIAPKVAQVLLEK